MSSLFSEKLARAIAGDQPWDAVLRGGKFILFDGAIPATPETAVDSARAIMELTLDELTWTAMASSTMTVTITAISALDTVLLNVVGIPIHSTYTAASSDTSAEAQLLADSINNTSAFNLGVRAEVAANVVTLHAPYGTGTLFDGVAVTNTGSGGTIALSGNFGSGSNGANVITWDRDDTTLNKLVKPAAAIWSGLCPGAVTTAKSLSYFRYILDSGDDGLSDDTVNKAFRRWQGLVGGSASTTADLAFPLVSTSVASGVRLTVDTFDFTIPLS